MKFIYTYAASLIAASGIPSVALAHEVYVLDNNVIDQALATPRFSEVGIVVQSIDQFIFWALIAIIVIAGVFLISISRSAERILDPWLTLLPQYAPLVSRVTIGISFLAAAYYGALFGPELPLVEVFGDWTSAIRIVLAVIGVMITVGFHARVAAFVAIALFGVEVVTHGTYMLTYTNYAGELLVLIILGAHICAFHSKHHDGVRMPRWLLNAKQRATPYAFLLLRVAFGVSLLYAALYAKVFNNQLALAVAHAYPAVVTFFGFEPHFLVLGAAIIEICIGLFFILGIEIRFTALFLLFWLSLSLWYFGEVVWPHVILIGIPIAFFFYGYDKYSLEGYYFKRDGREPIL